MDTTLLNHLLTVIAIAEDAMSQDEEAKFTSDPTMVAELAEAHAAKDRAVTAVRHWLDEQCHEDGAVEVKSIPAEAWTFVSLAAAKATMRCLDGPSSIRRDPLEYVLAGQRYAVRINIGAVGYESSRWLKPDATFTEPLPWLDETKHGFRAGDQVRWTKPRGAQAHLRKTGGLSGVVAEPPAEFADFKGNGFVWVDFPQQNSGGFVKASQLVPDEVTR